MPTCQKCNYEIVLLPRGKYKCSLCSKTYPKKQIDNEEFRRWNKLQKELEIIKIDTELAQDLEKYRELKKSVKLLFKAPKKSYKYEIKDKYHYNEVKRKLWNKHSQEYNITRKSRYNLNKSKILNYQKQWEEINNHSHRLKRRLADLREQQKCLAVQFIKNKGYKLYSKELQDFLPTFLHSYLLLKPKSL